MAVLRSPSTQARYLIYKKNGGLENECIICDKPVLKQFAHWKVIENSFPYDLVAKTNHMLAPIRHVSETGLSPEELRELLDIKMNFLSKEYDWILENVPKNQSVNDHFHLHLLIAK